MLSINLVEQHIPRSINISTTHYANLEVFVYEELLKRNIIRERDYRCSAVFVSPTTIKQLNKQYRNKNATTDILSYGSAPPKDVDNEIELGDLMISLEDVLKNADRFGVEVQEEINRVIIHGILHLLGMEHEGVLGESDEEMLQLQEKLVEGFLQ